MPVRCRLRTSGSLGAGRAVAQDEAVWRVLGHSVRGASHRRTGAPNQDAILWWSPAPEGPPIALVVSDGHGSDKSFRSEIGSQLAVVTTMGLLRELLGVLPQSPNLSAVKRTAEERLPQEIVRGWQAAVDAHLVAHPFTEEELARLEEKRGVASCRQVLDNPRLAYGATVLAALVTRSFLLFVQLGDGDILMVLDSGEVVRPMSRDARLIANETTSLCMEHAWEEVQLRFQASVGGLPALILLATDGYANSFVNEAAFLQVGTDLLAILQEDGAQAVEANLSTWLEEASVAGSGDDISLGILYRSDVVTAVGRSRQTAQPAEVPVSGAASLEIGKDEVSREERAQIVARIKHEGPREPAKRGRMSDLIDGGRSAQGHEVDAPREPLDDRPGEDPDDV
jgi:serine/threonine protein phosphatase PrpC